MSDAPKTRRRLSDAEKVERARSQIEMIEKRAAGKKRERASQALVLLIGIEDLAPAGDMIERWLRENAAT